MIHLTRVLAKLVAILAKRKSVKLTKLAILMKRSIGTTWEHLRRLKDMGAVECGPQKKWTITKKMAAQLEKQGGAADLYVKTPGALNGAWEPNASPREVETIAFVQGFTEANGRCPSLEEIANFFGVSRVTIFDRVKSLERKRIIAPRRRRAYAIIIRPTTVAALHRFHKQARRGKRRAA